MDFTNLFSDVAPEINAWSGISKIASWSGTPTPLENKSKVP